MDSDSSDSDFTKIDFDFSMIDFFGDYQWQNNMTEIENFSYFSTECGNFPDLEKVAVS